MKKQLIGLTLVVFLLFPLYVHAGVPLDTVQNHVENILDVVRSSGLKGEAARENNKEKIRSISNNMFDYRELSKRTLARNWKKFNHDQQNEFVDLYKMILEKAYIDKILDYTDEKVVFHKEKMLTEKKAKVHSNIITKTVEIPVNYSLILKNGAWRVYDVIIEGVSLVNNYRSQFKQILMNKSPEELLDILRKKADKA
ncbi:MAG: ABC transporter substrate-binding protein [Thermodesulfovibrionia bacterium]|nr:ABC transporter substrate-binding protein [Thermodesulfovibrionia bacterium]